MQDLLSTAIEMHQAGQLGPAAQLYQKVLAKEATNAPALHLLGVLHHQRGEHQRAVELIGQAVALRPNVPAFHANLAEAYRALGKWERAIGCCRAALQLWAEYPEALCNLGVALQGAGRAAEAIEPLERALQLRPEFATAHNNLGIALRELGRGDEALEHFRKSVELEPGFAPAQTNLGQMLLDRGQSEEALPHCQEAACLAPDMAAVHHNLGNALRALDRRVEARAAYLEALRIDPKLGVAQAHLGLILQKDGELEDAVVWLKQAVTLEPANVTFWENLAELHDDREEPHESIPCWEKVLALSTEDRPGPHLSLGWALQEEGRLNEAGDQYRTALALNPQLAAAQLNLGGLHEELGALADAEAAFRAGLKLSPAYAACHARLATLLRGKLPEPDLIALEARLADPELDPGPRGRLLFAQAHVLDARGDYPRAAECLRRANALAVEQNKGPRQYVPADHESFIDRLIEAFSADWFAATSGAGLDSRRPVFVFGLPRSGTTLIEQVLASHPRIHGAGELRLARISFEGISTLLESKGGPLNCLPDLDAAGLRRLAEVHLAKLKERDGGRSERVVDKMPDNYMYLGLLARMFPQATYIHARRDLRDIAVSCWMTDFRSIRWANDPEHIASRFRLYRRLMDHWQKVLPVPLHPVDYEETVSDLEAVARRLLAACGLEWHPACLDFHRTRRPVRTASITQVRQPIYTQSVARWKNYDAELGSLFAALPLDS